MCAKLKKKRESRAGVANMLLLTTARPLMLGWDVVDSAVQRCVCVWCVCIRFLCIYVHSLHIKNTHTHTHIYGLIVRVLAFEVLNHVCGIMMRANVRVCVAGCHYYWYTGRCHTIILKTIRKPRRTQNQPKGFRHMKDSGAHIYASSGHTHRIERERERVTSGILMSAITRIHYEQCVCSSANILYY